MPENATQMNGEDLVLLPGHILRLQFLKGSLRVPNALNERTLFRAIRVLWVHVLSGNGD